MPRDSEGSGPVDDFYGQKPVLPPSKKNLNVTCPADVRLWLDEQLQAEGRAEGEERRVTDVVVRALRFQRDAQGVLAEEWWEIMKLAHSGKRPPGEVMSVLALEALEARREKAAKEKEAKRLLEGK